MILTRLLSSKLIHVDEITIQFHKNNKFLANRPSRLEAMAINMGDGFLGIGEFWRCYVGGVNGMPRRLRQINIDVIDIPKSFH